MSIIKSVKGQVWAPSCGMLTIEPCVMMPDVGAYQPTVLAAHSPPDILVPILDAKMHSHLLNCGSVISELSGLASHYSTSFHNVDWGSGGFLTGPSCSCGWGWDIQDASCTSPALQKQLEAGLSGTAGGWVSCPPHVVSGLSISMQTPHMVSPAGQLNILCGTQGFPKGKTEAATPSDN